MAVITLKQQLVFKALSEDIRNGTIRPLGVVLLEAGYSPSVAKSPTLVTKSKGFQELLDDLLPDDKLINTHKNLLQSNRLEHMVFPLYTGEEDPDTEVLPGVTLEPQPQGGALKRVRKPTEHSTLTDDDIAEMLAEVGGTVRKIVHGETARHVYFWAPNDKTRTDALKLAYDVKGKLKPTGDPAAAGSTYNTFIQQNTINPNTPTAQELVQASLDVLMAQTKRKVIDQ